MAWPLHLGAAMRKLCLATALCAGFFLATQVQARILAEIPFTYREGLIWLQVNVAGTDEPRNFLLDSGAGQSVINFRRIRASALSILRPAAAFAAYDRRDLLN